MFLIDAQATCTVCGWHTEGKNSMGNAARHHHKTGHYVQCELYYGQHFGQPDTGLRGDSDGVALK
jgi:hypothetical protein